MADMSDETLRQLLLQAEERLSKHPSADEPSMTAVAKPTPAIESVQKSAEAIAKKETVTVRNPRHEINTVKDDAGSKWFGLPKTDLTPEFRRDWQILQMRGILDPKHHKKALHKNPPAYSQIGEIIAGTTDSRASRLTRKEKKKTLFDEVMQSQDKDKLQTKFSGIQKAKFSGRKKQRRKGRK